jgi:hypothetical protein
MAYQKSSSTTNIDPENCQLIARTSMSPIKMTQHNNDHALSSAVATQEPKPTLDMFASFTELPRELRNKVWAFVASEPRKVAVHLLLSLLSF